MSLLSFPEISVNSSSVTRGNNYKLLNQAFTTTYGIYTEDTPRLYMRDPACKRGPASIGTSESDPRPVCGAPASTRGPAPNRSFTVYVGLHVYEMNTRQRTNQHYSTTSAISVLLRCNSDISFPILGYLNTAKISWAMGDGRLGGGGPRGPPLNTPLSVTYAASTAGGRLTRLFVLSSDGSSMPLSEAFSHVWHQILSK